MAADHPAAHSMDTAWYAVDRDGHVAVFDSQEDGVVPESAAPEQEEPVLDRFGRLFPLSLVDFQRAFGPGEPAEQHPASEGKLPSRPRKTWWTLMFLESADLLRREIARGSAYVMPATEEVAVRVRNLSRPLADRLHQAGACLGCFGRYQADELASLFGLFVYVHSDRHDIFRYSVSVPYARRRLPIRPLRAAQLPPDFRAQVERMRFASLCFAEAERIQPVDHIACQSWGSAYLDLDGTTLRAVAGREADFRQEFDPSNLGPGYRIEPPGDPPATRRR